MANLRTLNDNEINAVAGGDGFFEWLSGLFGSTPEPAPNYRDVTASRYSPVAGQHVETTENTTYERDENGEVLSQSTSSESRVYQPNGLVWLDSDGDGDMDYLMWEDPTDNDQLIDSWWDEQQKKWWIGVSNDFPTPTTLSGE